MTPRRSLALAMIVLAGCPTAPSPEDAAVRETDAAAVDAASIDAAVPVDAAQCDDFSGAYTVVGTCDPMAFVLETRDCVAQDGCSIRLEAGFGGSYVGEAIGSRAVLHAMGAADGTAEMVRNADGTLSILTTLTDADTGGMGEVVCNAVSTRRPATDVAGLCCLPPAPGGVDECDTGSSCGVRSIDPDPADGLVTACNPVGTAAAGEVCTRDEATLASSCAAGLYCTYFGSDARSLRRCVQQCTRASDCGTGRACQAFNFVAAPIVGVCRDTCTLFDDAACPSGASCRPVVTLDERGTVGPAASACVFDGASAAGTSCTDPFGSLSECAADLTCLRRDPAIGGDLICQPTCRLDASDCAPGEACIENELGFDSGMVWSTGVGTCQPAI